jgi:hypothetical protein
MKTNRLIADRIPNNHINVIQYIGCAVFVLRAASQHAILYIYPQRRCRRSTSSAVKTRSLLSPAPEKHALTGRIYDGLLSSSIGKPRDTRTCPMLRSVWCVSRDTIGFLMFPLVVNELCFPQDHGASFLRRRTYFHTSRFASSFNRAFGGRLAYGNTRLSTWMETTYVRY